MTNVIRFYIILFAVMFFWVYNTPAFASRMTCSPPSDAGIVECITSDGRIVTIGYVMRWIDHANNLA